MSKPPHSTQLQHAQMLQEKGELVAAKRLFETILKEESHSFEALHGLGMIAAQAGEWDRALGYLEKAQKYTQSQPDLYFHLGQVYRRLQKVEQAIQSYERALEAGYQGVALHLLLANLYMGQERMKEALLQYDAALKLDPGSIDAHYQLGLYFLKTQSYEWAKIQFKNVLALDAAHVDALFHLGIGLLHTDESEEANQCFERVIHVAPAYLEAWVNLGAIALKKGHGQQAIDHFTQALTLNPEHEPARSNLAATFMHYARHENALTHYQILLDSSPKNLDYLYNAAVAEMTLGQLGSAQSRFLEVLSFQPDHFESLYNLALLLLRLRQPSEANEYLVKALKLRSSDPSCLHLLDALNGKGSSPEIAAAHATRLFDQYASYYDQHLLSTLHYRLPVAIDALLNTRGLTQQQSCVLDLGCGTGLCGEILRPKTNYLVGVDLSSSMLERAQAKGCYDECIQQDAASFLQQTALKFDLIVAADLFPYIGDLAACFAGVRRCLQPGGQFIFSVEEAEKPLWYLQETARYAHHPAYIQVLCEEMGLDILFHEQKAARDQESGVVKVQLYLVGLGGSLDEARARNQGLHL